MMKSNFEKTRRASAFGPVSGPRLSAVLRAAVAVGVAVSLSACALAPDKSPSLTARQQRGKEIYDYWQARCAKAGVFVYHPVPKLEGVLLDALNFRHTDSEQFVFDDPYGRDESDDSLLLSLMQPAPAIPGVGAVKSLGLSYVEFQKSEGQVVRYSMRYSQPEGGAFIPELSPVYLPWLRGETDNYSLKPRYQLARITEAAPTARYKIEHTDISTVEDRKHWTAGSSLRLVDRLTGEVMAERIGYLADVRNGDTSGGRQVWASAALQWSCPSFEFEYYSKYYKKSIIHKSQSSQIRRFLDAIQAPQLKSSK